ncbi:MAG: multidrug resistance protein MdtG [Dehalococcoidia bacterium]|jgi:MFS family permease|nr:MAG: multidrug resistance protein MdtG [Dehalococcoidia bacterium]
MPSQDWRRVLVVLTVALLLEVVTFSHVGAFVPLYLETELQLTPAEVKLWTGLVAGMPLAIALCLAPFWGVWAERYSPKVIIVRAQVFELIVYLGMVVATTLPQFVVAALLLGLTYGNIAVLMAVLAQVTPSHRVGFAISIIQAAVPLGQSLGPLFGSFLIPVIGLRGLFTLDAVLVTISAAVLIVGLRDPARVKREESLAAHLRLTFRQAVRLPAMRWTFLTMFLMLIGMSAVQPYIPIFLGQYYEGDTLARMIGLVLGSAGITTVIVTPLVGFLGDRHGHDRFALLGLGAMMVIHLLLFLFSGPLALITLLLIRNVPASSTMSPLNATLAIHAPADNRAALISLAPFPRNTGMFLGPVLAAAVATYDLRLLFPFAALLFATASVAGLALGRALHRTPRIEAAAAGARGG